ncbi:MAG: hypothetical protein QNJ55_26945 [Xenococcus sp. MO_188.B8]|nr:hypothetical protein [Xenococcus sp. MO_188.B8]
MNIEKLSVILGDKIESNQQLIEQLESQVPSETVLEIKKLLDLSGANTRRLSGKYRSPFQYLEIAFEPLKEYKDDIEIVINTGITKGVIEPAQGALYCQKLKINQAQAFDITEACNGFVRGLQIAHSMFSSGYAKKYILIISNEINDGEISALRQFSKIQSVQDVQTLFSGLTTGVSSTCMLLSDKKSIEWKFLFEADNKIASVCTVALPNYQDFIPLKEYQKNMSNSFRELTFCSEHKIFLRKIPQIRSLIEKFGRDQFTCSDVIFVHSHSQSYWYHALKPFDVENKIFGLFPSYGNLATGTLPVSLLAKYPSQIPKNTTITYIAIAAGFSVGLIQLKTLENITYSH